jgi:hypothetical protein
MATTRSDGWRRESGATRAKLAGWISGRERFTRRDAHRAHLSRFREAADLDPALSVLEAHGWIRQQPTPDSRGRGRRSSPTYDVNSLANPDTNDRNDRKPPPAHFCRFCQLRQGALIKPLVRPLVAAPAERPLHGVNAE